MNCTVVHPTPPISSSCTDHSSANTHEVQLLQDCSNPGPVLEPSTFSNDRSNESLLLVITSFGLILLQIHLNPSFEVINKVRQIPGVRRFSRQSSPVLLQLHLCLLPHCQLLPLQVNDKFLNGYFSFPFSILWQLFGSKSSPYVTLLYATFPLLNLLRLCNRSSGLTIHECRCR